MTIDKIKHFVSQGNPHNDCYVIRFKDFSNAVGYFDKQEVYTNASNSWKFYLNNDLGNKIFNSEFIEVDLGNIMTLDKL